MYTFSFSATSATFRAIDMCTNIVAPLITGQLMTYTSNMYGAVFIAAWNIVALFVEYVLITRVYTLFPALQLKCDIKGQCTL